MSVVVGSIMRPGTMGSVVKRWWADSEHVIQWHSSTALPIPGDEGSHGLLLHGFILISVSRSEQCAHLDVHSERPSLLTEQITPEGQDEYGLSLLFKQASSISLIHLSVDQ